MNLLRGVGGMVAAGVMLVQVPLAAQGIPALPDSTGFGVHVLALARAPDSSIWVGTYGDGIYVLRKNAAAWEHIMRSRDTSAHSISFDFVHAFAFGPKGQVWYGTVGNGWGVSSDNGKTWRNWEFNQLGPEWQYVAPNGIATLGDTTYIATADGIKVTGDDGNTWSVITDSAGATTSKDPVIGRIPNQYVLAIAAFVGSAPFPGPNLWISTLKGLSHSPNGGRTWHIDFAPPPCPGQGCVNRVRALLVDSKSRFWVGTEQGVYRFGPEFGGWKTLDTLGCPAQDPAGGYGCPSHWEGVTALTEADSARVFGATARGLGLVNGRWGCCAVELPLALREREVALTSVLSLGGSRLLAGQPAGLAFYSTNGGLIVEERLARPLLAPSPLRHTWFGRPIALTDQPYIDQTYRWGSTMGGYFQQHQGVEFNNSDGTPVHAIGDGVVEFSGPAEAGANTVAIKHDRRLTPGRGPGVNPPLFVFSVYYHNTRLLVKVGDRVKAGDVIALVGNSGRATNDHLHLEVHASPVDSVQLIVDPNERYPRYTTNPELWIEPLPGTGVVAGQVWDSKGQPVQQARVYGLVKAEPQETPYSYAETYGQHNQPDPVYHEHFAVSDVPPGEYTLGVEIEGKKVSRRVRVDAGKVTWVEFRP
jgi:murein DD-endopeptidase MepM/ murein hydrolase activator NlpD